MPVQILRPSAIGDQDNFSLIAGATKMAAVDSGDPVTHDDVTTFIRNPAGTSQSFQTANIPVGIGIINSIKLGLRARTGTDGSVFGRIRFNTTDGATGVDGGATAANWVTIGPTAASRPGGGSYIATDLVNNSNAFQMNVYGGGVVVTSVSTFWGELDFNYAAGSLILFILELLGPLVAVGLHEIPALAVEVYHRSNMCIRPNEYTILYQELRNNRYTRHFLLRRR